MGAYYYYCNLDRREYFSVGLCGQAIKRSAVGRLLGARALGLLLLADGRWCGDKVCVLADDNPLPQSVLRRLEERKDFDWLGALRDVRVVAVRALLAHDSSEMRTALEESDDALTEVAFFADHGDTACESFLLAQFGEDWRARCAGRVDYSGAVGSILSRGLPVPTD